MTQALSPRKLLWHELLNSNHVVWTTAIILSLSIHYFFIFYNNKHYKALPDVVIQKTITHVRFSTMTPPPIVVQQAEVSKPETKPEPIIPTEPTPVVKKVPEKKKPEPVIKKKPEPKPKPRKKIKPLKKTDKKPKTAKKLPEARKTPPLVQTDVPPTVAPVKRLKPAIPTMPSQKDQRLLEQTRKNYHTLLLRHIEVYKHYPRAARRRRIEGNIEVSFTLLADGSITDLIINGKQNMLKKATKNAINNALPMPKPPKKLSLPLKIKFIMSYFLK